MSVDWEWLTLLPLREGEALAERARAMAVALEPEAYDRSMEIRACWWIGEAAAGGPGLVAAVDDWGDRGFFEDMLLELVPRLAGPSLVPGALAYVRLRPDRVEEPALWVGPDGVVESETVDGEPPDVYACEQVFVALDLQGPQGAVVEALDAAGVLPELVRGFRAAQQHASRTRVVVPLGRADVVAVARQLEAFGPAQPWASWGEVMGWSDGAVVTWFLGTVAPWRVEKPVSGGSAGGEPVSDEPVAEVVAGGPGRAGQEQEGSTSEARQGGRLQLVIGLVLLAIAVLSVFVYLAEQA